MRSFSPFRFRSPLLFMVPMDPSACPIFCQEQRLGPHSRALSGPACLPGQVFTASEERFPVPFVFAVLVVWPGWPVGAVFWPGSLVYLCCALSFRRLRTTLRLHSQLVESSDGGYDVFVDKSLRECARRVCACRVCCFLGKWEFQNIFSFIKYLH